VPDSNDTSSDDQPTPPVRRRIKAPKVQTANERVDEDLSVSHFYIQSGDFQGAYLRAQDAVKTQPDYALAHFSLAEAAEKLNKNSEAVQEFQTYLKLEPDGKKAKAAEKALEKLN
jgi:Tfp pilus assembly protein PilF